MTSHDFQVFQLATEMLPPANGKQSRVLIDNDQVKIIAFGFAAGDGLAEHVAPLPALLQVVTGEAAMTVADQSLVGKPGTMIQMAAGTPHSITATIPTVIQLVLLKSY